MSEFDIQGFLIDMRHEVNTKIDSVARDVKDLTAQGADHNTRLTLLERFQQKAQWVIGAVVTAIIGALVSAFGGRSHP